MYKNKKKIILYIGIVSFTLAVILYPTSYKYLNIAKTYFGTVKYGKEIIYSEIAKGDISRANEILNNKYTLSRFEPVTINEPTWDEDPYSDIYWRFNYYNLEPVRNLLFAWKKTAEDKYERKMLHLVESFIDTGMQKQFSWDLHGAAFRAMTLVNVRESLNKKHELSPETDKKLLEAIHTHGEFLANPEHFEKDYNHGLDQAAALLLIAVNFPQFAESKSWLDLSSKRISGLLSEIIDTDGVLVENSPYYHFYVMEKFLEISKYLKKNNITIDNFSNEKLDKMASYAVYILQPDLTVPTIGASISRKINLFGIYQEIANKNSELMYVLTQGGRGKKPSRLNIQYPDSGQTIMRSAWNNTAGYENQTQLIFDIGNYRTNHSDLDALSFNLFGEGIALMPDAGLYSYDQEPYRTYFHGTKSHNTVVVDGKDQAEGGPANISPKTVTPGYFEEGNNYVYQSAQHNLYDGVSHERAISMIEGSLIIVIDKLNSESKHTYEQMFHLFPGAKISEDGNTLYVDGKDKNQKLIIQQLNEDGIEVNINEGETKNGIEGLCSTEYKVALPCNAVSFKKVGTSELFVTSILIGNKKAQLKYDSDSQVLSVITDTHKYSINIEETSSTNKKIEINKNYDISQIYDKKISLPELNNLNNWVLLQKNDERQNDSSISVDPIAKILNIKSTSDGNATEVLHNAVLDLSEQNLFFKVLINNTNNLEGFDIYLSNDSWNRQAIFSVKGSIYDIQRDNEWMQFGAGKSESRKADLGGWILSNGSFDWSKVDGIKLRVRSKMGKSVYLQVKDFSLVPDENEARATIIFDDGWASVLLAAQTMHTHGFKGNVAVITKSIGDKNYMSLNDIKTLQNDYGWDIVNHSSLHKDAVSDYAERGKLQEFDADITDALTYLIKNDINSAPNWYVYPDGRVNEAIKGIVERYYKFARATHNLPVVYPFTDPLEVGVLPVYSNLTTVNDVHNAIKDAIKFKQTIFIMFHKFTDSKPNVYTETSLNDFSDILSDIEMQGIKVVTLSELDKLHQIPSTDFSLEQSIPSQIKLKVNVNQNYLSGIMDKIKNILMK